MSSGYSYGTHHWPVSLRHERVLLSPMRRRDQATWERVRRRNAAWLKPWEATLPPGSSLGNPTDRRPVWIRAWYLPITAVTEPVSPTHGASAAQVAGSPPVPASATNTARPSVAI